MDIDDQEDLDISRLSPVDEEILEARKINQFLSANILTTITGSDSGAAISKVEYDDIDTSLYPGRMFNSYHELKQFVEAYEKKNYMSMYMRGSHKIGTVKCGRRIISPKLIYYDIRYSCHFGGPYRSQSLGKRPKNRSKKLIDCPFYMSVTASSDGLFLVITKYEDTHNHEIRKDLAELLPKNRRLNNDEKLVVASLLKTTTSKKLIRQEILKATGKRILPRDLSNLAIKVKSGILETNNNDLHLIKPTSFNYKSEHSGMELQKIIQVLEAFAPLKLACSWDNVGLLYQPTSPHFVNKLMLTNDLTTQVMDEAIQKKVTMIISYHPPIFQAVKRLTQNSWKERLIIKCAEKKIALFSPHTSWDVVKGGLTDWLISPFSKNSKAIIPNSETYTSHDFEYKLNICIEPGYFANINNLFSSIFNLSSVKLRGSNNYRMEDGMLALEVQQTSSIVLEFLSSKESLATIVELCNDYEGCSVDITKLIRPPASDTGEGRIAELNTPIKIQEAISRIKKHLMITSVRVATPKIAGRPIHSVAVCAGSGSSVLKGVKADLYITGEMSHHDVLDAIENDVSVILTEHSNSERGFLRQFVGELANMLEDKVEVIMSQRDKEPLESIFQYASITNRTDGHYSL